MYQLMRVCQNHYEKILELSYTLPEHFWRYFAVQCLRLMGGTIGEPSFSDREGRIESCLKNCLLNVSGEPTTPSCIKTSLWPCNYLYAICCEDVVHNYCVKIVLESYVWNLVSRSRPMVFLHIWVLCGHCCAYVSVVLDIKNACFEIVHACIKLV